MSTYYYIGCDECKELLHISQGNGEVIYYGDEGCMVALGKFLKKHEYCDRLFYSDEHRVGEPEQGYTYYKKT